VKKKNRIKYRIVS